MRRIAATFLICVLGAHAQAQIDARQGIVDKVQIRDDGTGGGCMIKLKDQFWPNCTNNQWVSMDCDRTSGKDKAYKLLDSAQMAYALGVNATVFVDTTLVTAQGHCIVTKIINERIPTP